MAVRSTGSGSWTARYMGVFLLSASTLMMQVSYIRILSVALSYHFVWMVVSIALLGYGASGTFLAVQPRLMKTSLDRILTLTAGLCSISILISYKTTNLIPFDPSRLAWDRLQLLYVTAYYLLLSIPFFLGGLTMTIAVSRAGIRIGKLYFFSLLGSGLGSITGLPLFAWLTGPGVVVFTSLTAGSSALAFSYNLRGKGFFTVLSWMLVPLILTPYAGTLLPVSMSPYKSLITALRYPEAQLLDTRWNAFSRVDVVRSGFVRYAPGLSLMYRGSIPDQLGLTVDGDALNAVTRYLGELSSTSFVDYLPSSLPFMLVQKPRVLVVDAGGGLGVLIALHHNSSSVVAVEANPIIVELIQGKYDSFSGSIYRDKRVRVLVSDGRSFIRGASEKFDVIELSMMDGASASSTGIYSLAENYLYTVESFKDFIICLSDDGFLTVSRWLLPPPREDVRIVSLAISALGSIGIEDTSEHIAVIRTWGTITLLVKRTPISPKEVETIREFCGGMGYDIVHVPGVEQSEVNIHNRFPEPIYYKLVHGLLHTEDREAFYKSYLYNIRPVTDEKPFFFHFFKWDRLLKTYQDLERRWQPLIEGGYLVPITLIQALGLSVLLILLPLRGLNVNLNVVRWNLLAYFFCLGLGFMLVEIAMIQRFILFLGHPTYSVSVVLFSLLFTSGLGSYLSGRIRPVGTGHTLILLTIGILTLLYSNVSPILRSTLYLPLMVRFLVTPIILVPLGILLGMPFPLGIRMLSKSSNGLVPWVWAANGCASVIGAMLSTIIALFFGFSRVFHLACVAYIFGLFTSLHAAKETSSKPL